MPNRKSILFLSLLIVFYWFIGCAKHSKQEVVIKDGEKIEYYEPGKTFIKSIGFYKNGNLDGEYKEFYPGGQLQDEVDYKNGLKNGIYKEYYEDEDDVNKTYVNGKPEGQLEEEVIYVNGKKEGVDKFYNHNGSTTEEQSYKDGLLDGIEKLYGGDGKLMFETNYKDGKENGIMKAYDVNGKLQGAEFFCEFDLKRVA